VLLAAGHGDAADRTWKQLLVPSTPWASIQDTHLVLGHGYTPTAATIPLQSPLSHALHAVGDVAPAALYGAPLGHTSQRARDPLLNVPAGHSTPTLVVDPAGQYRPGVLHTPLQALPVLVIAVALPNRPVGQSQHMELPLALYVPTGHIIAVEELEAVGHAYPAVHGPAQVAAVVLARSPYLPAGQSVQ
jgi:hypothetical protein